MVDARRIHALKGMIALQVKTLEVHPPVRVTIDVSRNGRLGNVGLSVVFRRIVAGIGIDFVVVDIVAMLLNVPAACP